MERNKPMDMLLCGDVGYGKTEVAFRAIFKAVNDGKQVAYLCPTTILSSQQYKSALNRFIDFPINIALLNRFTSVKEQREILEIRFLMRRLILRIWGCLLLMRSRGLVLLIRKRLRNIRVL